MEPNKLQLRSLYCVIIGFDLFFLLVNSPLLPPVASDAPVTNLISSFVRYQLDLKSEGNIASWYSSALLLVGAASAGSNAFIKYSTRFGWLSRLGWITVGLIFLALSADEVAQVHEQWPLYYNQLVRGTGRAPIQPRAGDWLELLMPLLIAAGVILATASVLLLKSRLPSLIFALTGLLLWTGVLYAESLEAGLLTQRELHGFIEESLELIGTTFFILSFLEFRRTTRTRATQPLSNDESPLLNANEEPAKDGPSSKTASQVD